MTSYIFEGLGHGVAFLSLGLFLPHRAFQRCDLSGDLGFLLSDPGL